MGRFEGSRGSLQVSPACILNSSTPVFVYATSCPRATMNFFYYYIHLEEIPEFLLLLKFDLFTALSEHSNFVFHVWCRHSYRQICQSLPFFSSCSRSPRSQVATWPFYLNSTSLLCCEITWDRKLALSWSIMRQLSARFRLLVEIRFLSKDKNTAILCWKWLWIHLQLSSWRGQE